MMCQSLCCGGEIKWIFFSYNSQPHICLYGIKTLMTTSEMFELLLRKAHKSPTPVWLSTFVLGAIYNVSNLTTPHWAKRIASRKRKKNSWQLSTAICSLFIVSTIINPQSGRECVCIWYKHHRDHHKLLLPIWLQLYYCTPPFSQSQVSHANEGKCVVTDEVKYVSALSDLKDRMLYSYVV